MKKFTVYAMSLFAAGTLTLGMTSCSSDNNDDPTPSEEQYHNKTYGYEAIEACNEVQKALTEAKKAIDDANLTDAQKTYLDNVIAGFVDNTVVPTYTDLGTAAEEMKNALGNLSASQLTQKNVNDACTAFKKARKLWEQSEAFLGGAAADFSIDPHIDSWPLNRTALVSYFKNPSAEIEDESILGFHALEFILFRDGQPRKVSDFSGNDTYKGFENITGAQELAYAETVLTDLLAHVYELECAWSETPNATRLAVVTGANLPYRTTDYDKSYGWNIKNYGNAQSTFKNIYSALGQILSTDDGSALAIANEVGNKKIANPFTMGDISYVESPYSYNSIIDFQDNIRSIENVWYGGRNGASTDAQYSFHKFFAETSPAVGKKVEDAIAKAIEKIGGMPAPFVKYVSLLWDKEFVDAPLVEYPED